MRCMLWFNFNFPLFWKIVVYGNEGETMKNKNWTKDKIEAQHI